MASAGCGSAEDAEYTEMLLKLKLGAAEAKIHVPIVKLRTGIRIDWSATSSASAS